MLKDAILSDSGFNFFLETANLKAFADEKKKLDKKIPEQFLNARNFSKDMTRMNMSL